MDAEHHHEHGSEKDPVCNMAVTATGSTLKSTHGGAVYDFWGQGCKGRFDRNPGQYVSA